MQSVPITTDVVSSNLDNFTIHSAAMDDSGPYICYVTHKNYTSRIGTTPMDISVEGKFDICKTFDKTSLTPPLFIEVSVP
jgi:hypothetical protein